MGESRPSQRSWVRRFLPPQHGAWAMLVAPWLLGTAEAGWSWWALLLLVAWMDAYLLSYFALQALKTRRAQRVAAQLRAYGVGLGVTGVPLLLAFPWLLLAAAVFLPFTGINIWYARRRDERATLNGLASVTQACLMAPVAFAIAGGDERQVAEQLFVVSWLYFAGTVLYVKTMIRERGDTQHLRVSIGYHAVATLVAWWISPWLALVFAALCARAVLMPRRAGRAPVRPAQVGALEIVATVVVVAVTLAVV